MIEQHSLQSLSARTGASRAAVLGAVASGALPIEGTDRIGARKIYRLKSEAIADYKDALLRKLEARVAKITKDPLRRREIVSSSLAAIRNEVAAEAKIWSPARLRSISRIDAGDPR